MNHPLIKRAVLNSIEMGLANPPQQYRSLLGHLLALSRQYARTRGLKDRGPIREQAASIIDALRGCAMPFVAPSQDDPRAGSAYWRMLRSARPHMKMEPPTRADRTEWDRERRRRLVRTVSTKAAAFVDQQWKEAGLPPAAVGGVGGAGLGALYTALSGPSTLNRYLRNVLLGGGLGAGMGYVSSRVAKRHSQANNHRREEE